MPWRTHPAMQVIYLPVKVTEHRDTGMQQGGEMRKAGHFKGMSMCPCVISLTQFAFVCSNYFYFLKQGLTGWAQLALNCNLLPQILKCYNYRQVPPCCACTYFFSVLPLLSSDFPPLNLWLNSSLRVKYHMLFYDNIHKAHNLSQNEPGILIFKWGYFLVKCYHCLASGENTIHFPVKTGENPDRPLW